MRYRNLWVLVTVVGAFAVAHAQWLNHSAPGTPRTRDGKPNLSARAPRASKGRPDLSGIWLPESSPFEERVRLLPNGENALGEFLLNKYFLNILFDLKPEDAPLQPSAAALFRERVPFRGRDFQTSRCLPAGVPASNLLPIPYKLVQTPGLIVMLYEEDTSFRQIFIDGRKHPPDPQPAWLGYSVGAWEGDTLVVDTVGFNDRSWLDAIGHPHSDAMHVTERFHRLDFGHMEVQITIEDSKTYTRPFSIKFNQRLLPDTELMESFCAENEKDRRHLSTN